MSLFKITGVILVCSLLTACFRPLHTSIGPDCTASYPIKIATISDRYGQILRNNLLDLLTPEGPPCKPKYTLEVKLSEMIIDTGVLKDETISRKQVTLTADIVLRDACFKEVYKHTLTTINSFPVLTQNYYANTVAETYSKKQGLDLLAQKIKIVISAFFQDHDED